MKIFHRCGRDYRFRITVKSLFSVCLALLMSVPLSSVSTLTASSGIMVDGSDDDNGGGKLTTIDGTLENSRFLFSYSARSGEFSIEDKQNHMKWYSNPQDRTNDKVAKSTNKAELSSQLMLRLIDTDTNQTDIVSSAIDCVSQGGIKVTRRSDSIVMTYQFVKQNITVPVRYTLGDDYFEARVLVSQIKESDEMLISTISLLPMFSAAGKDENGYMLVPDGSGALINLNNNKTVSTPYSARVYGPDRIDATDMSVTRTENVPFPVFGIKMTAQAAFGIITEGDALASVNAFVNGRKNSYNDMTRLVQKDVSVYDTNPVTVKSFAVRYYLMDGNADYNTMAACYRNYLINEQGFRQKTENLSSLYLDVFGAGRKADSFFGIPYKKTVAMTTFDQVKRMEKDFQDAGVDAVSFRMTNWSNEAFSGRIPRKANPLGALGGRNGLKRLEEYMRSAGSRVYYDINFLNFKTSGNGFYKSSSSSKTINSDYAYCYRYSLNTYLQIPGSRSLLLSPGSLQKAAQAFSDKNKKGLIRSVYLVGAGNTLYSDYARKSPYNRQTAKKRMQDMIELLSKNHDVMVEDAGIYAVRSSAAVMNAPDGSSQFDITDMDIPFYQMVAGSFTTCVSPPLNEQQDYESSLLQAVATGSRLHFSLAWKDPSALIGTEYNDHYSASYQNWRPVIIEDYNRCKSVYAAIGSGSIQSYQQLSDGVSLTVFENGVQILVNRTEQPFSYKGASVDAMDFKVL